MKMIPMKSPDGKQTANVTPGSLQTMLNRGWTTAEEVKAVNHQPQPENEEQNK